MLASSNFGSELSGETRNRAGWGIGLGILTAVLGLLLIVYPLFAAKVTAIVIGSILIVTGVFELLQALRAHTVGAFITRLLLGVVYGFGGVVLVMHPLWGVAVLTVALGIMLVVEAGAAAVLAFQMKPIAGWSWLLFDAAITAILGFLILAHWPASSIWAIGTLVGAALFIRGVTRIALSMRLRRIRGRLEEMDARPRRAA